MSVHIHQLHALGCGPCHQGSPPTNAAYRSFAQVKRRMLCFLDKFEKAKKDVVEGKGVCVSIYSYIYIYMRVCVCV